MQPLTIAIDASRITAARRTGTENYALQLIRALLALDMELHSAYHLLRRQPPRTDRQAAEAYSLLIVQLASVSAWLKLQV